MKTLFNFPIILIDLTMHDLLPNVTTDSTMTVEMHTFYSTNLIDFATPNLVHDQAAQKHPIPQGKGKTIDFRVKVQWAKMTAALTEGTTPNGQTLSWTNLTATVAQYGGYATVSDMLDLTAADDNIMYATELCGDQAGRTLDTITREVLNGGTNVQYADAQVASRYLLVGGDSTASNNHYLSVNAIRRADRTMKVLKNRKINGAWFGIIHPDVSYDIKGDADWEDVKKYSDPDDIYEGEIGKIHGTRFVETTEAKIFHAANLTAAARNLGVASVSSKVFTMDEAITSGEATALVGRKVIVKGVQYTVAASAAGSAGAATITVAEDVTGSPGSSDTMYPGEAGAAGRDVYSTLVIGADAYGVTEITGGGLQIIVKQLGAGDDPLNQRATVGWKATKVAKRLLEEAILRIETTSTFESGSN